MNKIYKVIYNKNKHRYEVVSELAKSHGGKCKTTVATAGDTNWLRRLWMRVRGGANKRDEDGNPVTMSISRAAMAALMCISVWSAAAVSSSWVEAASVEGEPVSVKYDEATGTIKIIKTDPNTSDEMILATYAVGGNISPITSIGTKNPTGIIAIGDQSKAVQSNTIAIGTDAHAGNVDGSDDTNGRIAIGTKTVASGDRSIALGNMSSTNNGSYNIVQGNDSIGIGTSTSIFGYSGVSIGRRNIIGIPDPDLVKDGVLTTKSRTKYSEGGLGGNSVIVGAYNVAYGNRSNVIGTYSRAMGSNSVAIGSGVQSLSDGAIAIGKGSGYEFEDGSRQKRRGETEYYGRDWELPPEYKVLKQVLSNDIAGDGQYKGTGKGVRYENGGILPKYNNYGAGSSDPGGFIVEGKNALGIGTYTQVRGDSAIGLATGEMTADLSDKDKSAYAKDMRKIMDMEETLYDAKEALQAGTGDTATLKSAVKAAEESLSAAKKAFRETYLTKYSFVDGDGALGVGRQILAQGDRSMAVGDFAKAISSDAIAYGGQTLANGTNSMAIGGKAHVGTTDTSFDNSMAIGSHTDVQAGNAVALGAFSKVTGQNSLALGFGKQTDSAITYNSVSGKDSTLIGSYGNIAGNNSILIGSSGSIANDRVVGLGNNINIAAADPKDQENNTAGSVFLGDHAGYVKDSKRSRSLGQVDVVGSAGKMELTESLSSTKGALRDYTKDFIYIYMLERQDDGTKIGAPIAVRSDFAGGDSTVGVVSVGSTYQQQFNSLEDIKDYHSKVGSLITVPVDVTVQVTKNGVPLGEQQQTRYFAADSTRDTIYADNTLSEEDKAKVWDTIQKSISSSNTTYTVFETRRIQNVAPGLIGLNSTDAINGSQLFATNQMLGNLVGSLKKTLGDNVTVTEDGEITVAGDINTLGWIAKADTVDGSNGKVAYDVDKEKGETEEAYQARIAELKKDGYIVDASKVMTFKAGKNIELVQKPGEFSISTIDTPSFKSVELRGETKDVDGNKVTPVTMLDSNGMQVYTETVTPGDAGPTTTKKVSTTVNNEGVTTDGTVKVTNGEDGGKDLVSLGKGSATTGETDQDFGTIHVDGKQGADGTITIDRGTKSLTDTANVGDNREQEIGINNPVAGMDRITYTTKGPNNSTINHEVATLDDGFFLTTSKDVTDKNAPAGVKLNHTIKFTDGANTKVSTVTSDNNGVHSLHIDVTGLPVVYTDEDGNKLTKVGDKFYKDDQFDNGTLKPNATPSDAKNISIVNPDGSISKTDGSAPTTVNNVGSSIGGDVNNGAPTGSTINGERGTNSFIDKLNKVGSTENDAISKNAVVTTGDLKNLADTPLFFAGDSADGVNEKDTTADKNTFGRKLSQQMKILGGVDLGLQDSATADQRKKAIADKLTDGNIGVISDGTDTLTVKLAKELKDLDSVKVSNGKDGDDAKDLVTIGKEVNSDAAPGTDGENGTIGLNGKNGSEAVITIDRGTKSMNDKVNLGTDPSQDISGTNTAANMDRITYTTKGPNNSTINHEVATLDDGFFLTTSKDVTDKKAPAGVKLNDTIKFTDGANTKVSTVTSEKGVHELHVDVSGLPMSYTDNDGDAVTKIGDKYYKSNQVVDGKPIDGAIEVPADQVTNNIKVVNTDGTTNTPGTISNVASGIGGKVKDPDKKGANTFLENVNKIGKEEGGQPAADAISENVVVNAKDLKNLVDTGFRLNTSGQPAAPGASTVKIGETINVINGVNTKVSAIDDTVNGTHTFHIDVTGMPISYTDNQGNALTKIGDNYYKNTDITDGVPKPGVSPVDPSTVTDNIKVVNKDGSTKNQGTISNVKSAIDGVVGNGAPNGSTINGEGGTNTFIDNVNRIGADTNGIDKNSVVTTGDLKNLADTSLFFSGDAADGKNGNVKNTFGRKLSEEAKIVGGVTTPANLTDNNIGVVSNGSDTLTIKLAKQLTGLDSATYTSPTTKADDGDVTSTMKVDGNGIRFVGDKDTVKTDAPSLTTDGIDGGNKQITNVGSGFKNGDKTISMSDLDDSEKWPNTNPIWNNAVNVGDLKKAKDAATTEVTGTGKAIVTKTVGNKGQNIYNVHVDPVVDVVAADGKTQVVRGDDGKYYNPTDIENKTYIPNEDGNGGNWYNKSDIGPNGKPNTDAPVQKISPVDVKNNFVNPNGTGSIVLDNVKSGIGGEVQDPSKNKANTFLENVNKVGATTDGISENVVVNAKDLKNVVDTGFKLNTSGQGTNPADTVKIGDTIQVVDGKNTTVSAITHPDTGVHEFHIDVTGLPATYTAKEGENGQPVDVSKVGDTYQLADGTKLVKYGDKFYKPNQIVNGQPVGDAQGFTINDDIRLVNPNNGTDPVKITNVAPGVGDTDAVNMSQLKTLSAGSKTEVTGTGAAEVTKKTAKDGHDIYNVHVDKLMEAKSTEPGKTIVRGSDNKYYYVDDALKQANDGKWYPADQVGTDGKPADGAVGKDTTELTVVPADKLKNSLVNPNGNGPTVLDNVKSGIGGEVKDAAGNNTFIENINKVGKKNDDGTEAPGAISEDTVVNAKDLKNVVDTGFKLNTSGHRGDAQTVKIGETIKVVDGANTKVSDITPKDGVYEFHIDVTGLPVTYTATKTDANGAPMGEPMDVSKVGDGYQLADGTKLVKAGDKYYTPDQLENGTPKPGAEGLTIKESVSLTQDNSAPATLERVGSGRRNGMKANAAPMAWDKILNPSTADDKAKVDNMLTNAANIGDVRDAIKSITDGTSDNASGGFGLTGNNGDVKQDLGKTITVKGGIANKVDEAGQDLHVPEKSTTDQNTYVNVKDVPNADGNGTHKEMVVEIAKDLTDLDSVTVGSIDENGNGGTVINKDGMTVKDATGNNSTSIGTGTIGTSKTDKDGNTSSTNIDGGTITSEKKDKDGNKQSTTIDGSHMTLENKDKDGKLTGPKTEVSNKGITITPVDEDGKPIEGKKVELSDKGLDNGGNQIINVDSGLKDTNGSVKLKDATGDMLNNAVNVGDLKEAINNAQTAVDGDGAAEISKSVDDNGRPTYKVHVDKLVEAKADDGKAIVRGEDNKFYYKDESLQQGTDGKWYAPDQLNPDNTPVEGAVGKATTELTVVPQDKLKTSLVNPNGDGATKLDNIKSAIGGEVKDANGNNTFIDNLNNVGKIGADGKPIIGEDAAVTTGDLKNLADTPLYFSGDRAENATGQNKFDRKLSEETKIVGGAKGELSDNNIGVVSNGKDTLTVKLSKDLKDLSTIEVNDSVSVGKDGDSTVIKGSETTSSFTEVATGPDGQPLYEVDEKGEVVRDANGDPIPVTKTSSTTTGGGKLATDVEKVKMVDGKPVTSHETTTIDGSHFESKDKDGNYTTINGGEIKSYDKDRNGSVTIKGDLLTASSKDENGHNKVTEISSDGLNSTATTFERDGNGQLVLDPDTGLPKKVTNKTNINSDGFTVTRTDSEGNEVLKTTMQNGNIAIEKPQPIIDPTTGEAYKVLDKDGNWVPAHSYTKISDNGFEIQGINQSGTGISKVRLSSEGLDNGGNRITHVAEGVAPDDAVNVSQLRGLAQNINNDIANVGANAAALAGLKAIQYDPLEPTQIMAAVGTYRGKQAAALGIAHYKNEDTMFHIGVSIGSDHTMANIGVTYKFGRTDEKKAVPDRYKAGPISSTYVLQDEMVALKEENARMRANDEKMNAAYDEILDLVKQLKQDNEEMKKKLEKLEKK